MGKDWDKDKGGRDVWIAWMTEVFTEALRVIRPGGHAFVWALPRTSHWTATALEDAGWEIRDSISHVYGSGFPKSMDISKAIDRKAGVGGTIIGKDIFTSEDEDNSFVLEYDITAPSTPEAQRYAGYGTALKPSHEVWWLCRKPLSEPTIAQNVLVHGCGGLNIDATRIGTQDNLGRMNNPGENGWKNSSGGPNRATYDPVASSGRWPSNTLFSHTLLCRQTGVKRVRGSGWRDSDNERPFDAMFDGGWKDRTGNHYTDPDGMEIVDAWECDPSCPVRILGEQSGISKSSANIRNNKAGTQGYGGSVRGWQGKGHNDEGTAARYFAQFSPSPDELDVPFIYSSKASRAERNRGCEGLPKVKGGSMTGAEYRPDKPTNHPIRENHHPTVKSLQLMRYLCRLVGVPGGVILDPFMGSGSTCVAALQEGFGFIGIEQSLEYVEIARARIAHAMQEAGVAEVQGDGEWICHPSCPVAVLDRQSGYSKSKAAPRGGTSPNPMSWGDKRADGDKMAGHNDEGYASRFFAQFAPDSLWSMLEDEGSEL